MHHHQTYEWFIFLFIIFSLLALDLGVINKKNITPSFTKSLKQSLFYFVIALCYGGIVYYNFGITSAKEYFTAFFVEKSLALDNIFVISLIFSFLGIPSSYQHRVLFWGIIGVVILRGIFISLGATLISNFQWILFIFAAILILTGIKILFFAENKANIRNNPILKFLQKNFNLTKEIKGEKFIVRLQGRLHITPLLVALIVIETMDLIFAIDSIPAVFAITLDPYIAYTSNIFAILGLRALYFCLADIVERFVYMKYSLGVVLIFIGTKVFLNHYEIKIDTLISLLVIFLILAGGILASLLRKNKN